MWWSYEINIKNLCVRFISFRNHFIGRMNVAFIKESFCWKDECWLNNIQKYKLVSSRGYIEKSSKQSFLHEHLRYPGSPVWGNRRDVICGLLRIRFNPPKIRKYELFLNFIGDFWRWPYQWYKLLFLMKADLWISGFYLAQLPKPNAKDF